MILTQLIVRAPGLLNLSIGLSYTIPLKDTEREEKVAGGWILCLPILLNTIERLIEQHLKSSFIISFHHAGLLAALQICVWEGVQ